MKCSKCSALCADADAACYACGQPLGGLTSRAAQSTYRLAGVFALLGSGAGVFLAEAYAKREYIEGARILFAAVGIVVGVTLGFVVGWLTHRKGEA